MRTRSEQAAADEVAAHMAEPDPDAALNMVRLAKYIALRGHMADVVTAGDGASVVFFHESWRGFGKGWWQVGGHNSSGPEE